MLFTTTTQFAALALCLIAGWFFGLASSSGGKKWKARYAAEREAHAAHRKQGETSLAAANARIAELERENERLAKATPVAAPVVDTTVRPTLTDRITGRAPVAARTARPAFADGRQRGWFDFR
ncbi:MULTISPECIES: hypothetical protein [unclassified Sphingomonas]|jgi:hypothetical protein|uniref:hypothetical protein n=1 Tax=unclassified Sphingomonas TaxID=196159 RepID=UPI000E10E458|nr:MULTISPECIES: hypothetical protein [unclassified Sphingomonas]AXJ94689.1 hypothetical protein DM480_03420 [Sphingomonas sp. FARSPH]